MLLLLFGTSTPAPVVGYLLVVGSDARVNATTGGDAAIHKVVGSDAGGT